MRIPPSFELAYQPEEEVALELHRIAGRRLQSQVCDPHGWLFAHRIKSPASALAKLELGSLACLADMNDVYAATVVVPTVNELEPAVEAVVSAFPEAVKKPRDRGDAATFGYDDVHLVVSLGGAAPGLNDGLRRRCFEVQVRTGLQFAWWRATHDIVYKGDRQSWRVERLASQARASLELLDAVLADLRGAATLLPTASDDQDDEFTTVADWLHRWPEPRRPSNVVRFVESVRHLTKLPSVDIPALTQLVDGESASELIKEEALTPFQVVLALAVSEFGCAVIDAMPSGTRVLITEEMSRVSPTLASVPHERRVVL